MQLTLHATRPTPHSASLLVLAMPAWSVKPRRALARHYWGAIMYDHMTTVMYDNCYIPPPPSLGASNVCHSGRSKPDWRRAGVAVICEGYMGIRLRLYMTRRDLSPRVHKQESAYKRT